MAQNAPGKHHRNGMTLLEVADMFGDEEKAKAWIAEQRWPDDPYCPYCGSFNVQSNIKHKTMTHRCRDCEGKPMFSLKTGTVMEGSNLKYRAWAVGIYLFTTNIKGISSMKLHRELGIGQKAAWFMLHRLRKVFDAEVGPFAGAIEVDETFIKEKNKQPTRSCGRPWRCWEGNRAKCPSGDFVSRTNRLGSLPLDAQESGVISSGFDCPREVPDVVKTARATTA